MADLLVTCPECEGTGEIECLGCDGIGIFGGNFVCPDCWGTGEMLAMAK
jgi:DnaJ-class molecular chaperone